MERKNFLLTHAIDVINLSTESWMYDENIHLNVIENEEGGITPVCSISSMVTCSKTEAAPGDDDPDPDIEMCY